MLDAPFARRAAAPLRRPTCAVAFAGAPARGSGFGGPPTVPAAVSSLFPGARGDPWARSVTRITVESTLAPNVSYAEVDVAGGGDGPVVAVGDEGTIALGFHGDRLDTVFTGAVHSVTSTGRGAARLVALDGGAVLAHERVETSFEGRSAGDIVRALAAEAGVAVGTIERGVDLPFVAIDAARSVWAHLAVLARASGHWVFVGPDGRLQFVRVRAGQPAARFEYGDDVLAIERTSAAAAFGAVTVGGEGAAGTAGMNAWATLVKDPAPVTSGVGSGGVRRFSIAALRSQDAVRTAAAGIAEAAARLAEYGEVLVAGAPSVAAGATIEIDAAERGFGGTYLVTEVRHTFESRRGFLSRIRFTGQGAPTRPWGGL